MKYTVVIFDLDGTIVDSSLGIIAAIKETVNVKGMGEIPKGDLYRFIGPPIFDSFKSHYNLTDKDAKEMMNTFRDIYSSRYLNDLVPYDGIEELLIELKQIGCKLYVATNKRKDHAELLLKNIGYYKYFDFVCGSDVNNTITKTDMISECLKKSGQTKTKCVVVGDSIGDYNSAISNNVDFIGVTYGFGFSKEYGVELTLCKTVNELKELLLDN